MLRIKQGYVKYHRENLISLFQNFHLTSGGLQNIIIIMVTISDIAKITGYSATTVSRVLAQNGGANREAEERILLAARLTGYQSESFAIPSSSKPSRLIGVIVENESRQNEMEHPLFGGILDSFRDHVSKRGYDILYLSKSFNSGMSYIEDCRYRNVEGILIANSIYDDPEVADLVASGIPCVSAAEFVPGICTVVCENTLSSRRGVEYLIAHGHKEIGYIAGPYQVRSPAAIERGEGYKQALKAAGLTYDTKRIEKAEQWELDSGYKAAQKLFERCPNLTAVFCACDTLAVGAMQYLRKMGKRIPEDVSLVGFDDALISLCCHPSLTTFRQNREKIAYACAQKLIEAISGNDEYEIVRVPVDFVERDSVATVS